MSQKIKTSVEIDGSLKASQIANATTDTDKFLVSDSGTVKYRTGAEVLSDLGITVNTASKLQHQVKAGVAINKGQAVYVTSADGTNMIVGLASNASEATSSKTMGLLDGTVAINGFANVVTEGLLSGLSITGAVSEGDPVWLGTGGNLIYGLANKPSAPNHLVFIGIVTRVNANNGEIFVKVQNGFELNEIHDVDLKTTLPSGNDILAFEGAPVNLWKNKTIASVLGYTPYNASNPAGYISTYTETDTLASVTARGASTSTLSTFDGGLNIGNAKLRWGGTTSPTLGFPFTGGPNAFWIDVNDGDTGGLAIDNDGTTIYGAGDSGHVFRVIDEDVYQATSNIDASTTFRIQQGQNGGGYVRGNFEITGTLSASGYNKINWDTAYGWGNHAGLYLGINSKAADSELLDGIDSSRVIYGDNSTGTVSISDATLNGSLKSGFYTVGTGGIPNATSVNFVLHTAYNVVGNAAGFDLACNDSTTSSFYLRPATGGGKGSWQTIVTSANVGSYAVPASRTITINGTSYDLSANRSWTVTASETDTLQSVTSRGNTSSNPIILRTSYPYMQFEDTVTGTTKFAWQQLGVTLAGSGAGGGGYFTTYSQDKPFGWTIGGNQGVMTIDTSGNVQALSSSRAPIFYDSNDTTYYGDFNSTTRQYQAISFGDSSRYSAINTTINGAGAGDKLILYGGVSNYDARLLVGADYDMLFKSQGNSAGKGSFKFYSGLNSALALTIDGYQNTSLNGKLIVGSFPNSTTNNGEAWIGRAADRSAGTMTVQLGGNLDRKFEVVDYGWTTVNFSVNGYGAAEASGSMRAPIFYDSNDTGYYLNPNSTSNLLTVNATNYYQNANGYFQFGFTNNNTAQWPLVRFGPVDIAGGWDEGIIKAASTEGVFGRYGMGIHMNDARAFGIYSSGWNKIIGFKSDVVESYQNFYAPIMYDRNNTGYYVDPASTTKLNALTLSSLASDDGMIENNTGGYFHLGGWGVGRTAATAVLVNTAYRADIADNATNAGYATSSGSAGYLPTLYSGGQQLNPQTYFNNGIGLRVAMTAKVGYWSDTVWINGYSGGDVPWMCALHTQRNSSPRMYISAQQHTSGSYGTAYEFLTEYNVADYAVTKNTGQDITGIKYFVSNRNTTSDSCPLQAYSNNGSGATMSFHRGGYYAVNFGLDSDNVMRIGGWSAGANRWQLDMSGNMTVAGDVTAYSDIRVKENIKTIDSALDKVLSLRGVTYNRIDSEDKAEKIGVIAQEIQEVLPQVVHEQADGMLGVSYGNITAVLIEAIKEQQTQIEELKELVKQLTK